MKKHRPILSRLQRGLNQLRTTRGADQPPAVEKPENFAFAAEIPGGKAGKPLLRMAVEMHTQAQGSGEQTSMRVHWQANLASSFALDAPRRQRSASRTALPSAGAGGGLGSAVAERVGDIVGDLVRAGLSRPLVARLAEPLLQHDFNTWVEIRASSADLANAESLLPQRDRLRTLGVEVPEGDGPLAHTWSAVPGTQPGFAQISLMRFGKKHLPPALAGLLGDKPFNFAAAIVNVIEPKTRR